MRGAPEVIQWWLVFGLGAVDNDASASHAFAHTHGPALSDEPPVWNAATDSNFY
jgi:hypothetical protein